MKTAAHTLLAGMMLWMLIGCKTIAKAHPVIGAIQAGLIQSPLKVCPVRYLNPLQEGEKRWVEVTLYARRW